jgi:hypothetical protein
MLQLLRRAALPLRIAAALALLYLIYVFVARHDATRRLIGRGQPAEKNSAFQETYGGTNVKILQFYARDGTVFEGNHTLICYGVVNAKSVRIDPAVADVWPTLNRCVDVAPAADMRYTLTAEGNDGASVSASFAVAVRPDRASLPRITSFGVARHTVERGRHYFLVTYNFVNARQVSLDPPLFSPLTDSAPFGQFYASPDRTTTYTLTVTGKFGHKAQKQLTLAIPGR